MALGSFAEGTAQYEAALEIAPSHPAALLGAAESLAAAAGMHARQGALGGYSGWRVGCFAMGTQMSACVLHAGCSCCSGRLLDAVVRRSWLQAQRRMSWLEPQLTSCAAPPSMAPCKQVHRAFVVIPP